MVYSSTNDILFFYFYLFAFLKKDVSWFKKNEHTNKLTYRGDSG